MRSLLPYLLLLVSSGVFAQKKPRLITVEDVCDTAVFYYSARTSVTGKLSYSIRWQRPVVNGISNPAGTGTSGVISERLHNTTSSPVTVNYLLTMTLPSGCDHTDTLRVRVNPTPRVVSPLTALICDSSYLNYQPLSNVPSAKFTWTRPQVSGIVNEAATGTGNISERLLNDAYSIVKTPYYLVSQASGCSGFDTLWTTVVNRPFGAIKLSPVDTINSGRVLSLNFKTTDTIVNHFDWSFGDQLSANTYLNPVNHFYNTPTSITAPIALTVTNRYGCVYSFDQSIYVVGDPNTRPVDTTAVQRNYSMVAYPIPFEGKLYLKFSLKGPDEQAIYMINDLAGRIIDRRQIILPGGDNVIELPSDRIQKGVVYVIRVKSKSFDYEDKVYRK